MNIRIFQGTAEPYPLADINIVIDVIRAFTVSHIAFMRGAREVMLVNSVEEAYALKFKHPELLLAGEIRGLPIAGFDLDNSPYTFSAAQLDGQTLVQKTSNGVKATLLALNAKHVFVTGLSNARNTALQAKSILQNHVTGTINIIASHADDDDDLSCAEYIRDILLGSNGSCVQEISSRILHSRPAQKFHDDSQPEFDRRDLDYCVQEMKCDFVMEVDAGAMPPRIFKRQVNQPGI